MSDTTADIGGLIGDLRARRPGAARALVARAHPRLRDIAGKLLRESFPGLPAVEIDDVVNESYLRLAKALEAVDPPTPADFFRLAAHKMRQTLLDMANSTRRRVMLSLDAAGGSSSGAGLDPGQTTYDPDRLGRWTEFHKAVEGLPDDVREVFVEHYYLGLTQAEIAEARDLTAKQVSRLWGRALIDLDDKLPG